MHTAGREYCNWEFLLADAGTFWKGMSQSEVLLAQQSEADLLCLLRKKYGMDDREATRQISEYLGHALASRNHQR